MEGHINGTTHDIAINVWLLWLVIMLSGCICVMVGINSLFYCCNGIPFYACTQFISQSPGDGHLDYFQSGTMWINLPLTLAYRSLYGNMFWFLLGEYLLVRLLGHMVKVCLTFNSFPKLLYHFIFPSATYESYNFSHTLWIKILIYLVLCSALQTTLFFLKSAVKRITFNGCISLLRYDSKIP